MAPVTNGFIKYSDGGASSHASNTTVIVSCNLGFSLSGTASSTCQNGLWIPPVSAICTQSNSSQFLPS